MAKKKKTKKITAKKKAKKVARKLSPKQEAFCQSYVICKNSHTAAVTAGYSIKTAQAIGTENLQKPIIKKRIKAIQKPAIEKARITVERLFQELAHIATVDPAKMYDKDGKLLGIPDMPEEIRRAISGVDISMKGIKIKFWGKNNAIELLGKTRALNMFSENLNIEDSPVDKQTLNAARKDLIKDIAKELRKK